MQAGHKTPFKTINIVRRFSFGEWGGTETVVRETCLELQRRDVHTRIAATSALSTPGMEDRDGLKIRRFPYFYPLFPLSRENKEILDKKGGNPFSPAMYSYLRECCHADLSVMHCHTMGRLAGQVMLASQKTGVPYVMSLHGGQYDVPEAEIAEMVKPMRRSFNYGKIADLWLGLDSALEQAGGIISVGRNEHEIIKDKFPGKLSAYIPNGVNAAAFQRGDRRKFREQMGLEDEDTLLLCVSRIDYQKNQLALIELLDALKQNGEGVSLALIGPPTSESYHAKIMDETKKRGLEDNVTIIPGLPPESPGLADAYAGADIFVLPSAHEPFGIVALEAWSAGKPVIASETGGLKYLVKDGVTGLLCKPGDSASLRDAYFKLKNDPGLAAKISAAGRLEAEQNYSWRAVTDKLMDFYREVIELRVKS